MNKNGFYNKWLKTFASDVSKKEIEEHVKSTGNYIWHVFSYELINRNQYLVGEDAKKAYDKIDKQGAIYIDFKSKHTYDITDELKTAKSLEKFIEVYVVGEDFKWTYIKTHEEFCGPYFLKLK